MTEEKSKWVTYALIGIGVIGLIYFLSKSGGGASGVGVAPSINLGQAEQFNLQAAQLNDTTDLAKISTLADLVKSQQSTQANLDLGMAQIQSNNQIATLNAKTQEDLANIQAATTIQGLNIQSQASQTLANIAAQVQNNSISAQEGIANKQVTAQKNQGILSTILGGIPIVGNFLKGLGL